LADFAKEIGRVCLASALARRRHLLLDAAVLIHFGARARTVADFAKEIGRVFSRARREWFATRRGVINPFRRSPPQFGRLC